MPNIYLVNGFDYIQFNIDGQPHEHLRKDKLENCVKSARIRSYSGPHFPAFGLNTERYGISLHIKSKWGKYGPEQLRIGTLFTQCKLRQNKHWVILNTKYGRSRFSVQIWAYDILWYFFYEPFRHFKQLWLITAKIVSMFVFNFTNTVNKLLDLLCQTISNLWIFPTLFRQSTTFLE